MYKLDKGLVELINAQRAEAEEFSKQPGCFMGMMPEATELSYWESRVPSGTLKEYKRIELEEDAYYTIADAYSKSYARSFDFASMTDAELDEVIKDACEAAARERKWAEEVQLQENITRNKMCKDFGIDRQTLDRWLNEAEAA